MRYGLIGASAVGLAYLFYRLYRRGGERESSRREHRESLDSIEEGHLRTVHSNYSEFYFDKLEQMRAIVAQLGMRKPTVEDIYLCSPLIVVDEYVKYTREMRKRRGGWRQDDGLSGRSTRSSTSLWCGPTR